MLPANDLLKYFAELSEKNWTLLPIDMNLARQLRKSAETKLQTGSFRTAGIGREAGNVPAIRTDRIHWLSENAGAGDPDGPALQSLRILTGELREYFRVGATGFECHYAVYEPGQFYRRHRDTAVHDNHRLFSFVIYLNDGWPAGAGGELVGYEGEEELFRISPRLGQMVLFRSDLEHEVLPAREPRFSLTGWVRT